MKLLPGMLGQMRSQKKQWDVLAPNPTKIAASSGTEPLRQEYVGNVYGTATQHARGGLAGFLD